MNIKKNIFEHLISLFKQFTNLLDKFILKTSVDFKFCINLVTIKSNIKVIINIAIFFIEPFAFIIVTLNIFNSFLF